MVTKVTVEAALYKYLYQALTNIQYAIDHELGDGVITLNIAETQRFCDDTIKLMTTNGNDATSEEDIC